ncbi:ABC transporter ATP-binding protein [Taibaiella helva]|uniref:ABC transporter ATP-binding protein n=1 Tax=Taibaiella helva TaxID=2301235 RepID=UPI000E584B82|nr:ABC transporter ATP-binding protein [Taibaiella helva]
MKNIPKLLRYLSPYKSKIFLYFFTSLLSVVFALFSFTMLVPVLQVLFNGEQQSGMTGTNLVATITHYINGIAQEHNKLTALTYAVLLLILATILKNFFIYCSQLILNPLRHTVMRQLRDDLFAKTLALPIGFFTEERKGDLISRMTNDVNEVEVSVMSVIETIIREPLTILITLATMVVISPVLTLSLLLFLPLAGFVIGKVGKSLKRPSNEAQEQLGEMLSNVDETLSGMRVIKAFNAERQQQLRFRHINNTLLRIRNKISARRDAGSPMSETLGIMVVSAILWYGGYLIFSGKTTLTGPFFILFLTLFYQIINPLKALSSAFYNMQKGAAALDRIQELMSVENTITERPDAKPVKTFSSSIEFRNVGFSYGAKEILRNINLTIEKGKTVALVGASGAGKSTMADLIPRFHDVSSGSILLDGVDLREYKIYDLRKLIGMVSQEPILFNDTIANNITLGTGGATQEQIEEAARVANAHSFIQKKKEGYETIAGDRGSRLSGGERQRITIARAVLKNPPVLILDEATSSLDTESERIVQDAINQLMQNRTCIVIAHRLSTVQHADEIIVLNQGEIVERGTHQQLMAIDGTYKKLVALQQLK